VKRHWALIALDLPDPAEATDEDWVRAAEAMKRLGAEAETFEAAAGALADQADAALDKGEPLSPVSEAMLTEFADDQQIRFYKGTRSAWRALLHWLMVYDGETVPGDWKQP
jgi:hypothetical protein